MSDIETLREASHIVAGINTRLSLMTGVFAVCAGMGGVAFWNLNTKIDGAITSISDIRVSVSAQTEQLKSANEKLSEIAASLRGGNYAAGTEKATQHASGAISVAIGGVDPQVLAKALEQASNPARPDEIFLVSSSNVPFIKNLAKLLQVITLDNYSISIPRSKLVDLSEVIMKTDVKTTDNVSFSSFDEETMLRFATAIQAGR